MYKKQLEAQNVRTYSDFRRARLGIDPDAILPRTERERYLALPDAIEIRGREIPVRYDVEETPGVAPRGVVRLSLPEKIARSLTEEELPDFDRPVRFVVARGARGAARADSLDALREELDRPFTDDEIAQLDRAKERHRSGEKERRRGPRTPYGGTHRDNARPGRTAPRDHHPRHKRGKKRRRR